MTVRRDLGALESEGLVRRLVGGRAAMIDLPNREPALADRFTHQHGTKAHIGRAVADLIAPNEVLFLDGGTTALAVARALRLAGAHHTILTRSLLIAAEFVEHPEVEVFLLGGRLRSSEMATSNSFRTNDLMHYNIDTYVMGISGVHPTRGLTDYDPDESADKRRALACAHRTVLVADASKLGKVFLSRVAGVDAVDILATDAGADSNYLDQLSTSLSVVVASDTSARTRPPAAENWRRTDA